MTKIIDRVIRERTFFVDAVDWATWHIQHRYSPIIPYVSSDPYWERVTLPIAQQLADFYIRLADQVCIVAMPILHPMSLADYDDFEW
jgi:hypothetical protein